ncbi:phosphatase PAP2 family protein [Ferrovibrio xuzhouensis]|uniref:Phosphatase PAP2 family protein n=1 Tax=Ferrovibrio xuzhouensis TaxID=1576914 RepID=A0ABV7V9F9_9PROT
MSNLYPLDVLFTQAINGLAGHVALLDVLMIWTSKIGVPVLVLTVAAQWWRRADRFHMRHVLVVSGLSFLLGLGLNQLILLLVNRVRPYDVGVSHLLIGPSADPSFPSDHATATIAIAAAFFVHRAWRPAAGYFAAALLIMLSRVYIGTHYVSDVLGGALTGAAAAVLVRNLYREGTLADRFLTRLL